MKLVKLKQSMPLSDLKILIVDDSIDNQIFIGNFLRLSGALISTADDGLLGVEEAFRSDYDMILMDMQMPRLDGVQATTRLRKNKYLRPIIALTSNTHKDNREKFYAAGCDAYFTKPIQEKELILAISVIAKNPIRYYLNQNG